MENAQSSFISSTFWTERSGYVAGLKTLEVMENIKSWKIITNQGKKIKRMVNRIAKNNNISINTSGLDACPSYSINSNKWQEYKTFITQELLKKNILGANTTYVSICHNDRVIKKYEIELNKIFEIIRKIESSGSNVNNYLEGPISHSGFKRLN
jgi:glutamate-1-semialdehyde aminotransferase